MSVMEITDWVQVGRMDDLGRLTTPVHRLDARAKAIVTLAFIVAVMSFPPREVSALVPFLLYPVAMLSLGRIPAGHILVRLLVALPFALVIGIFNPLIDREPVVALGPFVISGGWLSFVSITVRFVLTVGAALLLVACTGIYRLGAALEQLGLPRVFVTQMLFLYRYIFVVGNEGGKMMRSIAIRAPGVRALRLGVYGSLVGHLLLRSLDRADRVHRAMVARGFDGEIRAARRPRFRWPDAAFVGGWVAFFAVARMWNLADSLGRMLTGGGQ